MPHRIPLLLDQTRDWLVVLYEPLMYWAFAASAAVAAVGAGGVPPHIEWLSMAGYGVGSIIDLSARGRAYAALPPEQRKSRWREWKERLQWGAIGLAFGVMLSIGVNQSWLADQPHWHPMSNTLAVGVVALPAIEFSRALLRALRGQSDVFAGLIIGWARRRSGERDDNAA